MGSFRFRHLRLLVGDDGELEAVEVVGRSVESVDRVLADERNLIEKKFHYLFPSEALDGCCTSVVQHTPREQKAMRGKRKEQM